MGDPFMRPGEPAGRCARRLSGGGEIAWFSRRDSPRRLNVVPSPAIELINWEMQVK